MARENGSYIRFVILFSGLFLGLGWAIRGTFGHEWGAAWAGSIGTLALLVAVNRRDWLQWAPIVAAQGGIGWGVGGMMSYGLMVASGRGTDVESVAYGYAMLLVIGGLYGFIGGGLVGLGLESPGKKIPWHTLITEMVVFGILAYVALVNMLGWKMTPPRAENWAYCLGAAAGLAWFLHRGGFHRALRVAAYAALGAGLGFSLGNVVQTLSLAAGTPVNAWNIMEFLLGFGGGAGMAYAVLTRDWEEVPAPTPALFGVALVFVAGILPVINRTAAFPAHVFTQTAESLDLADPVAFAATQSIVATIVVAVFCLGIALGAGWILRQPDRPWIPAVTVFLFLHALHYAALSAVKCSILYMPFTPWNTRLWYLPAVAGLLIYWVLRGRQEATLPTLTPVPETRRRWIVITLVLALLPLLFALIAISSHTEPIKPFYERFGTPTDI